MLEQELEEIGVDPDDVRCDVYSNTAGVAVRLTHRPTGAVVSASGSSVIRCRRQAVHELGERLVTLPGVGEAP